ncbi:acetyltransferase [Methylacidiphilum sp. Yel]|uniref:GNAT family N-acetyltransferase n=1 Tax=Methylacidiphilum sp. Yel TaxID=1847730 RepID=UPI00106C50AE|nr:GNAT family N-acetyltransferase [Methylacidiphilum sp. Yel]TFE66267.1 acetyltransferase [Methylacidiphilum sp. Yel]
MTDNNPFPIVLDRLILRPLEASDEEKVVQLAGDPDVSWGTRSITYPDSVDQAASWLREHMDMMKKGESLSLALILKENLTMIGAVILFYELRHERAEIGCWIAKAYWSKGYGTEACRVVLHYAFNVLKLNKISAYCLAKNIASLRLIEKLGMKFEGCLRKHLKVRGIFEDLLVYGLLSEERKG